MTDVTGSAVGGEASLELPADAPEEFSSVTDAMSYLTSLDEKRNKSPAESAPDATAENELPVEGNAASEKAPGENEGDEPEENLPPVERPRSWSKDDDDDWNALPRERQEKIAASERAREADINQRITKAAETAKAYESKAAQAEQARQNYEVRQAAYTQALETTLQAEFGDIQSLADVRKLQAEDPFRFQAWQVRQMELGAARAEQQQVEGRKAQEQQTEWTNHVQTEIAKAAETIPELADNEKKVALIGRAEKEFLPSLGFTKAEIDELSIGKQKLSIFDHRVLKLISDGMKYADIKAAPKAIAAKPLPPVQRPGTSRTTSDSSEREQALNRKPELTQKEALELLGLQSGRQRRRA